jgi:DNA-binding NarL/FixJ family response regulator
MKAEPEGAVPGMRVLVVHDSDVIRAGLVAMIGRESDLEIVGAVATAEQAIDGLDASAPDVILLDHHLRGLHGPAACLELVQRRQTAAVIALAHCIEDAVIHAYLRAGARGYLEPDASGAVIVDAVRAAARGEDAFAPSVMRRVVTWARASASLPAYEDSLAANEVIALSLVAQGRKNREIGRRLGVSEGSVKLYLRSAMRKLGVSERSQAVAAGVRRGVI